MPLTPDMQAKRRDSLAARRGAPAGTPAPVAARPRRERDAAPRGRAGAVLPDRMVRKIEELIAEVLGGVQGTALFVAHRTLTPPDELDQDALEDWERGLVAQAITAEALRYPRVRDFLVRLVDLRSRTTLPTVLMIVAAPRLLRHGIIPVEFGAMVEAAREAARKAARAPRRDPVGDPSPPAAAPAPDRAMSASGNGTGEVPPLDELERTVGEVGSAPSPVD